MTDREEFESFMFSMDGHNLYTKILLNLQTLVDMFTFVSIAVKKMEGE